MTEATTEATTGLSPTEPPELSEPGTPAQSTASLEPADLAPAAAAVPVPGTAADAPARTTVTLEQEGEVAADYLEELLDICDLDGDLDLDVEGDRAVVAIVGTGLQDLVGDKGRVLEALQELTRLSVLAQTGQRSRLMLDIAGHRAARRAELTTLGTETATQVASSGEPARLAPMSPFERKVVHDAVAAVDGVHSESEGEEPRRRVVVLPG